MKLVSESGRLLDMNPAGLAMIGAKDRSQVIGRSIISLVHPDDRSGFLDVHQSAFGGVPASGEYRIVGLSGDERWVESHSVPFDISSDVRAVLSVTSDITERKRLEEQLRQSQKMDAVGRLAGGIAHDFNNLLTVIGGYTETALAELPTDAPTAALLREVRRATDSAASLTRRLLTFSRRQIVRLTPLDLNAIVSDIEQLLKRTLGEDIEIVTTLPAGLHPIQGDATQLQQVLTNLAVNARDAMPRGGTLSIDTANVAGDKTRGPASAPMVELRVLRKSHPHTPVLFMSGYSDDTMARHGLTVDQYDLLAKPFSTTNLLRKVRAALTVQAN